MHPKSRPAKAAFIIANPKAKLLDQVREVLRVKQLIHSLPLVHPGGAFPCGRIPFAASQAAQVSLRTEEAYVMWVRQFLKFHRDRTGDWKHPRELGATEVGAFLNHLANAKHVAASTQNQALNALVFLYESVLQIDLGELAEFIRASKPRRVPVVLSREEVSRLLGALEGTWRLMAQTLYGTGTIFAPCRIYSVTRM